MVDPACIDGNETLFAGENVQRRAALAARFGKNQRTIGKIQGCQTIATDQLCSLKLANATARQSSSEGPARDSLSTQYNALPNAPSSRTVRPSTRARAVCAVTQQKRAGQPYLLEWPGRLLRDSSAPDIGGNIRQFCMDISFAAVAVFSATRTMPQ